MKIPFVVSRSAELTTKPNEPCMPLRQIQGERIRIYFLGNIEDNY